MTKASRKFPYRIYVWMCVCLCVYGSSSIIHIFDLVFISRAKMHHENITDTTSSMCVYLFVFCLPKLDMYLYLSHSLTHSLTYSFPFPVCVRIRIDMRSLWCLSSPHYFIFFSHSLCNFSHICVLVFAAVWYSFEFLINVSVHTCTEHIVRYVHLLFVNIVPSGLLQNDNHSRGVRVRKKMDEASSSSSAAAAIEIIHYGISSHLH